MTTLQGRKLRTTSSSSSHMVSFQAREFRTKEFHIATIGRTAGAVFDTCMAAIGRKAGAVFDTCMAETAGKIGMGGRYNIRT